MTKARKFGLIEDMHKARRKKGRRFGQMIIITIEKRKHCEMTDGVHS